MNAFSAINSESTPNAGVAELADAPEMAEQAGILKRFEVAQRIDLSTVHSRLSWQNHGPNNDS